ncbi:DUF3455 domain-containing protein [Azospirillaceae bacterium]
MFFPSLKGRFTKSSAPFVRCVKLKVVSPSTLMLGVISIASALGGCSGPRGVALKCDASAIADQRRLVDPADGQDHEGFMLDVPINSSSILNPEIEEKIYIKPIKARRSPAGTVEIFTQVVNCTDEPLQVEARTQFYDKDRAPSEAASGWRRVILQPRSASPYKESSIGREEVSSYGIEFR